MNVAIVDAFTRGGAGGNTAGVVLCEGLEPNQMQSIAAKLGFSETAFATPNGQAFEVLFFTPTAQVALCGHATIATWHYLSQHLQLQPQEYQMLTKAGPQRVRLQPDGQIFMTQNRPEIGKKADLAQVASALGLHPNDFHHPFAQVASTGLYKVFAFVKSRELLLKAKPNHEAIIELCTKLNAIGIYLTTNDAPRGITAVARNFAPVVGIFEDSATGTSAAACTGLLAHHNLLPYSRDEAVFHQGDAINQPSTLTVRLQWQGESIHTIWVGGHATTRSLFSLE